MRGNVPETFAVILAEGETLESVSVIRPEPFLPQQGNELDRFLSVRQA